MHIMQDRWLWAWHWLTEEGGTRATVILVFITAWYAWLTYRMAKAMNRQTRAMVQPTVEMRVDSTEESPCFNGRWSAKNLGDKPVIVLDARLEGRFEWKVIHKSYRMYERHVLPPQDSLSFTFDFTEDFRAGREIWAYPLSTAYNVEVVVADLSEDVVLTYRQYSHWNSLSVRKGMPGRVRWRIWSDPTRYFYRRMKFRVEKWLKIDEFSRLRKADEKANFTPEISVELPPQVTPTTRRRKRKRTQTSASPGEKSNLPDSDSLDAQ